MKSSENAREQLANVLAELGEDETRVMLALARRLLKGQREIGRLDLSGDKRDWRRERAEELEDVLLYSAFEEVRRSVVGNRFDPLGIGGKRGVAHVVSCACGHSWSTDDMYEPCPECDGKPLWEVAK